MSGLKCNLIRPVAAWGAVLTLMLPAAAGPLGTPEAQAERHFQEGVAAIRASDNPRAVDVLRKALLLKPNEARYHLYAGQAEANLAHFPEALAALKQAAALAPEDARSRFWLGVVYGRMGRWKDAVQAWEETLRVDPRHRSALEWLPQARQRALQAERLQPAPSPSPGTSPAPLRPVDSLQLAQLLEKQGNRGAALAEYRAFLARNPGHAQARFLLGRLYGGLGMWVEAVQQFQEVQRLDPYHRGAIAALPPALEHVQEMARGELVKLPLAVKPLRHIRPTSEAAEFFLLQGNALAEQGRWSEALEQYSLSAQHIPEWPALHYNMGLALWHLERLDAAGEAFKRALVLQPQSGDAAFNLGLVWMRRGRPLEAAAALEQYLQVTPDAPDGLQVRAQIRQLEGRRNQG